MSSQTFVKRKYNPSVKEFLVYLSENPHKNFPVIAEVCDDYYVMEYVTGTPLSVLTEKATLSSEDAKKYILQILDGIEIMHKMQIVHRDIKPENIIIKDDGTLKLIDFDISRKIITNKNCDTQLLGTAGYAAPEQFGFGQTDERTDIYSIGIIYNYMLTGKFPIEKTANGQTGKIISKCIKIDRKDRYKNVNSLRNDIIKERFTAYKLLDIIPGFRTRNTYKMIFSVLAYIVVFIGYAALIAIQIPDSSPGDIVIFCAIIVIMLLYTFAFFSVATNFMGVLDKLKAPVKSRNKKRALYLVLIFLFGSFVCFSVSGNLRDAIFFNPVSITVFLFVYMLYSIIEKIFIGML